MPELIQELGENTVIHIPIHWTRGVRIDRSMPPGTTWPAPDSPGATSDGGTRIPYPFVLVDEGNGSFVEISSRSTENLQGTGSTGVCMPFSAKRRPPSVRVDRTTTGFTLTFKTLTDLAPETRSVRSMEKSVESHVQWLADAYGARTISQRIEHGDLPAGVAEIPLAVTFDIWLANREVAHNYVHLRDFCADLKSLGVPPGVVIYIPGWCGPYDAGYPYYEPVPELGGRNAFAEAIEAAHEGGYRVMAHTLGWGTDPYVPGFERHTSFVMRNFPNPDDQPPPIVHDFQITRPGDGSSPPPAPADDPLRGPYGGWPGGGDYYKVESPPLSVPISSPHKSANGWLFNSPAIPERCEAVVSMGGFDAVNAGVVRITINGRSLRSPAGWFTSHEEER